MSNEAPEQDKSPAVRPKALAVMANRLNVDPQKLLTTLKDTVFKGATDSELLTLVVVANEYGLSPLLKEIYAFPAKGGGIVPVVSIDGWISMVNRQPQLDGLEFEWTGDQLPESCTCTIFVKGRSHPVRITEFYKECVRSTEPWKQMPRRMLRHKALKEAARVAFGFSGVTDEDEARDIMKNANAHVIEPRSFPPPRKVEPPDFTESQSENLGSQSENQPEPAAVATAPKEEKKVKRAGVGESPQNRLFAALTQAEIKKDEFLEGLKLVYSSDIAADAELLHELSDQLCEQILKRGVSQTLDEINDAKWMKGSK